MEGMLDLEKGNIYMGMALEYLEKAALHNKILYVLKYI